MTDSSSSSPPPTMAKWLDETNDVTRTFLAAAGRPGMINLGGGLPDPKTYPAAELAELARASVADFPGESLAYAPIEGLPDLRAAIAQRYSTRALMLDATNVLITSGGMQALDLLGKLFVDSGAAIAVQSPTYLGALDAWRPRHPVYRPMPTDQLGDIAAQAMSGARFAYTVPNFSNPTGVLVGTKTRHALINAARSTGTPLVEDDPYGALYYDEAPLPRMIELDAEICQSQGYDGPVIYLGTVSKELAPGLRVGWVIAAPDIIAALTIVKQGSDLATSSLSQRIVCSALENGLMKRIMPAILNTYRPRRDALCAALDRHLPDHFTWVRPKGGMFVWLVAKSADMDTNALMRAGLEEGVCISPGSAFDPDGIDRRSIRLNFTTNPPEVLEEGVCRLARAAAKATIFKRSAEKNGTLMG